MSKSHWRKNQQQDPYFQKAKEEGYRSRSAYKLLQINEKFDILKRGDHVLDLGAAPGGWSQVSQRIVGPGGKVVAIDLLPMEPIPHVTILTGDMLDPAVQAQIREATGNTIDVVMSDAAPSTSGIRTRDHALSIELAEMALLLAQELVKPGGHFVVKVFEGEFFADFLNQTRAVFASVKPHHPAASREESREMFVVARKRK